MIKITMLSMTHVDYDPHDYLRHLWAWQEWAEGHGLRYLTAGSERESCQPGQWMVQSYSREEGKGMWNHRKVCFNDQDARMAMMFKLTFGGAR